MKEFNPIQQTDPRYVQLGQNQLKILDDAKILEDSLLALAKRDPFLSSVVTKEVGELNGHIEKAVENVRERRKGNASTEMQLSMTSINNLALMLKDHLDMMMQMMANAMPSPGKGKGKGKMKSEMKLGQMQQQLNQQMEDLRNSGKSGRALSEELARMAAEQERIRRALQEMQEKLKQEGGKVPGGDLPGKMEQTEMDLVNKQITEQTIRRQRDILTRLLEAEKSMREQDMDDERKGETATEYEKEIPRAFEEYLRLKEKEVELLKTVPPKLYPYYKKEVNDYFKRIGNQQ
jgi:small-conductance mechanosensitive channel